MEKLLAGLSKFKREVYPEKQDLFEGLATGQTPEVLFITCADSRIDPSLLLQTQPGEIFICRNAGNMVPAHSSNTGGVSATIEYAVSALGVRHIIVCGHSDCGAMRGLMCPEKVQRMKAVASWLEYGATARAVVEENFPHLEGSERLQALTEQNVLAQVDNLRTHPCVAAQLRMGTLTLHAWYYDIPSGEMWAYDEERRVFAPVAEVLSRRLAIA